MPRTKSPLSITTSVASALRFHYVECALCESCFKVLKEITAAPAHKCWAAEKIKAQLENKT